MSNCFYSKGLQAFASGSINWTSDTVKAILLDLTVYALQISGATNAAPIVITTTTNHGLSSGDVVAISRVTGNLAANGNWAITVLSATTFSLTGSAGSGAYVSGGFVVPVSRHQYLSDIPGGAIIGTSAAFTSKTDTLGILDADDPQWTSVSGAQCQAIVVYKDTGVSGTSPLIIYEDSASGLPFTPNGGNVTWTLDNGPNRLAAI